MPPWHLKWVSNENGCSTSGIHMSNCKMIDHAASDVHNAACHEDENPSSPLVLKSLREDMKQGKGLQVLL